MLLEFNAGKSDISNAIVVTVVETLLQGVTVVLLGDLNCDVLGNRPDGRALNDFFLRFNLAQMVKSPTRVTETSKSIIDDVLTTNESIISSCDVKVCAISDHNLVCMSMKLKTPRSRYAYTTTRSYKQYDTNKFLSDLECVPFHMVEFFNDLDDRVYAFNCLFLEALNDHAPIKRIKIKSKPNPFISPEIKQLMNTRDAWHKSAIKSGDKLHWNAYRFFRQEVKREIRLAEMEHVRSELRNTNVNTNSIWKIINRVIPNKNSSPLMTVEDSYALANNFNEFYTDVGPTAAKNASALASEHGLIFHDDINQHLTSISDEDSAKFRFHSVTEEDVSKIIKNLPSNKAPGYEKVTARVLKASSPVTVPIIANLINGSFSHNTFPNAWKMAEVIPIQKSGDYEDPANTRPVSLLPIVSKVCERSALSQFRDFLDSNGIIHHSQSGNRKLHSTETVLLHYTDELLKNMDDKKISVIVLLDMSKASDSIRHDLLINKLYKLGVSFAACSWFLSYLSQRKQVVKIEDSLH